MADPVAERFRELARLLDAEYGFFIRTTDPEHEAFVQRFVERLRDRGTCTRARTRGCTARPARRSTARTSSSTARCPQHGTVPEWTEEKNWFFRLSAFQERCWPTSTRSPTSCCRAGA